MKQIIALLVAAGIVMAVNIPFAFADNSGYIATDDTYVSHENNYATREEAVAEFVRTTGINTSDVNKNILKRFSDYGKIAGIYTDAIAAAVERGMISGYEDGSFKPQAAITRIEALVILNRILSARTLPANTQMSFADTPEWAKNDINRLSAAGIVEGYGDGTLGARDFLTSEQAAILAARAARMVGPAGNYYEYINEEWLKTTMIPAGQLAWSDISDISQARRKEIGEIVYSLYRRKYKEQEKFVQGSSEQKIADVFAAAGNMAYRDSLGTEPVQKYLDMIDQADSMYAVLKVMADLEKSGFHGLLPFGIGTDIYDSAKYILTFSECYTGMNVSKLQDDEREKTISVYNDYLANLFILYGLESDEARERADRVAKLCGELADASTQSEKRGEIEENYRVYTADERRRIFTKTDTDKFLQHLGFPTDSKILIYDLPLAEKVNSIWKTENMELIKDYMRASVMDGSAMYLDSDAFAVWCGYQDALSGMQSGALLADYAVSITEELLGWDLAKLYVERYASADDKAEVEKMTQTILEAYKNRLASNTWMTEESKQAAIKKIEKLSVRVGYPDNIEEYPDPGYEIRSIREGGNLLEYRCGYCLRYFETAAELLKEGSDVSKDTWSMLPQTVNAMYEPSTNSITIPAGILHAPIYERSASFETNLGGIGTVIAHEISHALDSLGSKFDENGNLRNWWQEKDEKAFEEICERVVDAYNKIEVLPGQYIDGQQTLGENIADIAGMACILDIAGEDNPRLGDLFTSYAIIWRMKADSSYIKMQLQADSHAPDAVRVNRVLSNFDIFENYYDIRMGDGMYLPSEERIQIWNRSNP